MYSNILSLHYKKKDLRCKANGENNSSKWNPIVLELGCGKGEYAVGLAKRYPQKNFIGIDIKGARMWSGAKQALEEGINNVAFLRTNIELIDRFLPKVKYQKYGLPSPTRKWKKWESGSLLPGYATIPKYSIARRFDPSEKRQSVHVHPKFRYRNWSVE